MSFALPIAFTLAAIALPIVALYILKVRLRRVSVSTNLFWKQIYEEKPPRSTWQYFRHLLSLLMQLLLLLLIVLAIADPYFSWQVRQARRLVLVIDNSASMRATDVAPSRLEAAKSAAQRIVDGLRVRDEVAIVLAGNTPEVIVGMSGHAPTLRDAISGITFSDNPTQLSAAIGLGQELVGQHPHGQVVVLTDGAVDELFGRAGGVSPPVNVAADDSAGNEQNTAELYQGTDVPRSPDTAIEYRLFATDASNVGITQLQVRRSLIDPLGYEILASVRNASSNSVSCRLELSLNDIPVDVIPLNLKPDELWSRSIEKTSLEGGRLQGVLTQIQPGEEKDRRVGQGREASAGPPADDATETVGRRGLAAAGPTLPNDSTKPSELNFLATDDSAWALLPGRKTQRVLIVTQGNWFLQKVFEANPLVEVTVRKEFPQDWPTDSIIVLHGNVPSILPAGNVFVVDPIGSCDQWVQGEPMENPIVTEQDKTSPLMNHIRLDNVMMPEAKQLQFTNPPHSLAKTLSGEFVYAEVKRPNGKCLVLSVNLDRSDLAFRTSFPIMVANSLGWFSGSTGELQQSLATGTVTTVAIEDATSAADAFQLAAPDGTYSPVVVTSVVEVMPAATATTPAFADSSTFTATIGPLNEVGVWSVQRRAKRNDQQPADAESQTEATTLSEVAVNLASARETDLRPLPELVESPQTLVTTAGWFSRPFWYYLILLACILTTVEWFLYQRRLIS
jgi:hypothetical protein